MSKYDTVVGLEVHIQMNTKSKAFCGDALSFGASANRHISEISLAHPGTLPTPNKVHVDHAIRLGLALGCEINQVSAFDRKHYYYADLPKAYQITQDRLPICIGGSLPISLDDGTTKNIKIHHIHMEEDAGKTIHDQDQSYSLVDLNRAGTPLLELVTEPVLSSGDEVLVFISTLQRLVRYLEISDGDMEKGSLRCDVNISVKKTSQSKLGERCEVKNVNSKKFAKEAVEYECKRQIELLEDNQSIVQQTLHFDPITGKTSPLRDKENADDYRYFPDPDLPPIRISNDELLAIKSSIPMTPWQVKDLLKNKYGLSEYDAELICQEKKYANFFVDLAENNAPKKLLANVLINKIMPLGQEDTWSAIIDQKENILEFLFLIEKKSITKSAGFQQLWPSMIKDFSKSPKELAKALNLMVVENTSQITTLINQVLTENDSQVKEYKAGKKKLFGFLLGLCMRKSKGTVAPDVMKEALHKCLQSDI